MLACFLALNSLVSSCYNTCHVGDGPTAPVHQTTSLRRVVLPWNADRQFGRNTLVAHSVMDCAAKAVSLGTTPLRDTVPTRHHSSHTPLQVHSRYVWWRHAAVVRQSQQDAVRVVRRPRQQVRHVGHCQLAINLGSKVGLSRREGGPGEGVSTNT